MLLDNNCKLLSCKFESNSDEEMSLEANESRELEVCSKLLVDSEICEDGCLDEGTEPIDLTGEWLRAGDSNRRDETSDELTGGTDEGKAPSESNDSSLMDIGDEEMNLLEPFVKSPDELTIYKI